MLISREKGDVPVTQTQLEGGVARYSDFDLDLFGRKVEKPLINFPISGPELQLSDRDIP